MESIFKFKPIRGLDELFQNIQNKIDVTINEFNIYLGYLKNEKFVERSNEKVVMAIKRAESIYDRLDEMIKRNGVVLKNGKETIDLIDNIKLKIENILEHCENDGIDLARTNNELIDKIIELEERKKSEEIEPFQNKIELIKQTFIYKKKEWETHKIDAKEILQTKEKRKWKLQPMSQIINFEEMKKNRRMG